MTLNILCFILFCFVLNPLSAIDRAQEKSKKEKLVQYLSELVSFKTITSDKKCNLDALNWVQKQLAPLDLYFESYTFEGHPSLIVTTKRTKKPILWLVAHIDVVPAPPELFVPKIKNQKMYARGAFDMKMAIACYILLMQELGNQVQDYNIGIMLTSDEEIGGLNGTRCLLNKGYSSQVALLPDGGFDWKFEEAAKGVLQLKVTANGKSAHGARPWEGINAIETLMQALASIQQYFAKEQNKFGHYYPTVNIGMIQGGEQTNQVPNYAEAKLDIRFPPSLTQEKIFSDLQNMLKIYDHITIEKMISGSPNKADLNLNYFKQFKEIASQLYGINVGSTQSHGASDARFFGERKIPVLVIAPMGGEIHGDGEWVDLDDLLRFYEVMKKWVVETAKE